MNLIVLNPGDVHRDAALVETLVGTTHYPLRVCRMTQAVGPDGPPHWTLTFSDDSTIRTQIEPEGMLCATLLTTDHFEAADELTILNADSTLWPTHFERLADARTEGIDVFLSFEGDGPSKLVLEPDHASVLRLAHGRTPGMAWYRSTRLFYESAQQVIRKDARWNGQYTIDCLLRQLALHDARIGFHARCNEAAAA